MTCILSIQCCDRSTLCQTEHASNQQYSRYGKFHSETRTTTVDFVTTTVKSRLNVRVWRTCHSEHRVYSHVISIIANNNGVSGSGSATGELGHYGSHPRPQVADRGTRMDKRVARDKEGAADEQCLRRRKTLIPNRGRWSSLSLFRQIHLG